MNNNWGMWRYGVPSFSPHNTQYCWECLEPCASWKCRNCPRYYHPECLQHPEDEICPPCTPHVICYQKNSVSFRNQTELNKLLAYVARSLRKNCAYGRFFMRGGQMFYPRVNLKVIRAKAKQGRYLSLEDFQADVQYMDFHIKTKFPGNFELALAATNLEIFSGYQLLILQYCNDCYKCAHSKRGNFTKCCREPHLLAWVETYGMPLWPAKIYNTPMENVAYVRFFGGRPAAFAHASKCKLMMKKTPKIESPANGFDIRPVLDELDRYVHNLGIKFQEVEFFNREIFFDNRTYSYHRSCMFPNFNGI